MPTLHIKEYAQTLTGKSVFIACREGILRDHFSDIIADIKFLNRQGIRTSIFHNMSNRFANQKHFRKLTEKLAGTTIVRVPSETDFYKYVLDYQGPIYKLIFLERKFLIDRDGRKINALTTQDARNTFDHFSHHIANANFKDILEHIFLKIEKNKYDRVHILPAGKNTIKHELFTIEGSGTLIANNFTEEFKRVSTDNEVKVISDILGRYKGEKYLKPRSKKYFQDNKNNFYVTKIDGIIVGCVEKKEINKETVELGALAISTKFRNQRIGVYTINSFIKKMILGGYHRFIALTNNPSLEKLFLSLEFVQESSPEYSARQKESPNVKMFFKRL